jgi:hypothetical protein
VYDPTFRRGDRIWSRARGREVRRSEAIGGPPTGLVDALGEALETKRAEDGQAVRSSIPKVYRDWAPTGWADLLAALRDEPDMAEVTELAAEEFRALVAVGLNAIIALAYRHQGEEEARVERRSLIAWAGLFAKSGRWQPVRNYLLWCRLDQQGDLRIALRVGLFAPGQAYQRQLAELSQRQFSDLCVLYNVGSPQREGGRCRPGGQPAVELTPEYLAERFREPVLEVES